MSNPTVHILGPSGAAILPGCCRDSSSRGNNVSTDAAVFDESHLEKLSPMEERFEFLRKRAGYVLAPITFVGLYFAPLRGLDVLDARNAVTGHNHSAHALAAIMATTAVLWICESIPMVVTALAAAAACILFGVGTPDQVFKEFAKIG